MEKVAVISVASDFNEGCQQYLESCKVFGIQPILLGLGIPFRGLIYKARLIARTLKQLLGKVDIVLHVDAYDSVFVDNLDSIVKEFRKFGGNMVCSAEKVCWPPGLDREHPESPTAWCYLNSGGWIGDTWFVDQAFDYMQFDSIDKDDNDQRVFQEFFVNNPYAMALDYHCRIFQSLHGSEVDVNFNEDIVRNDTTEQYPKVIHGNGHVDMTRAVDWVNWRKGAVV